MKRCSRYTLLALRFRIMFPLDLHDDPRHTLTHHQPIKVLWCSSPTHPRDILSTGQPDGGAAKGSTTVPLSSTRKKATVKVCWGGNPCMARMESGGVQNHGYWYYISGAIGHIVFYNYEWCEN